MPELPEVQTIVDDLNKKIKGDVIVGFWSDWPKAIKGISAKRFEKEIGGRKILKAWRLGKGIYIDLDGGKTIHIHLKMTGHLLVKTRENFKFKISNLKSNKNSKNSKLEIESKLKIKNSKLKHGYFDDRVNQYIRHSWKLKGKSEKREGDEYNKVLDFSDLRKFGKIVLMDTDKIFTLPEIRKIGVDAVSKDFSFEKFDEILEKKKKSPIGIVLMEQSLIAGIGNIYRSEILFEAGIHPKRLSGNVSGSERKNLHKSIGKVLNKAIKLRGTSDSDYRDTDGAPGGFQKILKVYGREGERCKKCDTIVSRFKLAQRSVFFCPVCQKL